MENVETQKVDSIDIHKMDNESGSKYFQERYTKAFTDDDPVFQECLTKKLDDPPIIQGYRIFNQPRRSFNNNNNNNNNHNRNNDFQGRRFNNNR